MEGDAGSAQAQALLNELWGQVARISYKLEAAEQRNRRAELRGICRRDPTASALRRELCEAHRLIDGLHRRFPDVASAFNLAT
jgi:hypothetical protein